MKTYNKITKSLLCILLFGACAGELDIKPTSELENEYFTTEFRVQQGMGACYASITNMYGALLIGSGGMHKMRYLPGDDVCPKDAGCADFEAFSGLNSTTGEIAWYWQRLYQLIYRTNFMLDKLENPDIQKVVTRNGLIQANKGEALFLRAWAFYRLWDWFRKAPIQDKRISAISDAILPPSEGFQMLDKAIEDLELAATLLPNESYWDEQTEKGRVFNESAYGLLVKCYVLKARYNNKNADDYKKAIAAFEKITTRKLVHFLENFDYHFENNAESLFEFQASQAIETDNSWLDNNFGGQVGQMGAMYQFFTDHWATYESSTYGPTKKLIDAFEQDDPRKEGTFSNIGWGYFDGYQIQKYIKPGRNWGDISSTNNPRLIRYADIKLLAAEAYLQTGDAAKALVQVNDIRERARRSTEDGTVSTVPANLSGVTMDDIIHERFLELAAEEGIRWTDLRSWHAAGIVNLSTWTAADFGYNYATENFAFQVPKHLLFPIPQSELDANPLMATSGNNPGY